MQAKVNNIGAIHNYQFPLTMTIGVLNWVINVESSHLPNASDGMRTAHYEQYNKVNN